MLDVAIIGSGPAALSAALYLARAGFKAKIFERAALGGELSQIAELANYPGFNGTGKALADAMWRQAESAGAEFGYGECEALRAVSDGVELTIDGESVLSRAVLIATGSNPKQLSFEPRAPVSYCALCDGELARDKNIAVIGGANTAVQEALYLAPLVRQLTLITHSQLKADATLVQQLRQVANVTIQESLEPTSALLEPYDYIFVCIGRTPATHFLQSTGILDERGYIVTGATDQTFAHQTAIPEVFAAGDVRAGMFAQVITAAGDGAAAAIEIARFLRRKA